MSKELKALKQLGNQLVYDEDGYATHLYVYHLDKYEKLEKLLEPLTEEEVCEALSEWFKETIKFKDNQFYYLQVNSDETVEKVFITIDILKDTAPEFIIMIGRFYEGKTNK